jgi:hypothetical protein
MPSSLSLMPNIDIICITETWLTPTPPSKATYPINWKQYHTYGPTTNDNHGTRGISLLINPRLPHRFQYYPHSNNTHTHSHLPFQTTSSTAFIYHLQSPIQKLSTHYATSQHHQSATTQYIAATLMLELLHLAITVQPPVDLCLSNGCDPTI